MQEPKIVVEETADGGHKVTIEFPGRTGAKRASRDRGVPSSLSSPSAGGYGSYTHGYQDDE
jgi:hypothetical protein